MDIWLLDWNLVFLLPCVLGCGGCIGLVVAVVDSWSAVWTLSLPAILSLSGTPSLCGLLVVVVVGTMLVCAMLVFAMLVCAMLVFAMLLCHGLVVAA